MPPYAQRQPSATPLYELVRRHYRTFEALTDRSDHPLPKFVKREFERFLECGIHAHGFARVRCEDCGFDRLVPFSCKGRGFCPSCLARFMNETAILLTERVLPPVPLRQWVLSVPPPLRYLLAYNKELLGEVVSTHVDCIFRWLRSRAKRELGLPSVRNLHPASVTAIQRFGSAAGLNIHLHTMALDGVYVEQEDGQLVWHTVREPSKVDVRAVAWDICDAVTKILRKHGLWIDVDPSDDQLAFDEPTLSHCAKASLAGVLAFGARSGQRVMRWQGVAAREPEDQSPRQTSGFDFNLHASVVVPAGNTEKQERLCRYILRPPLANSRLRIRDDDMVVLALKRPWSDGTTHMIYDPIDFMSKLAVLVPPPRMNRVRYHGLFAPNAKRRALVVPRVEQPNAGSGDIEQRDGSCAHRVEWAKLLAKVFKIDVFECSRCGGRMQRIAWITYRPTVRKMLTAVGMPADSPEPDPPRLPPQQDFDFAA